MKRTKPPFRADHVGSLLRPAPLKEARAKHEKRRDHRRATARRSRTARSRRSIRSRRRSACELATDGEFRRSWWQFDFYKGLDGVELYSDRPGHRVRRRRHQGRERAGRRQGRLLRPSAARAFPLPQGPHQGGAEDDHPGARDAAFPPGPPVDQQRGLSRPRRLFPRRRRRPTARPSAPSTTPAAAICSSTTPPGR